MYDDYIDEVFDEEIKRVQEAMKTMTIGTEEYSRAREDLESLTTKRDERKKAWAERKDQEYKSVCEIEQESKNEKREKRNARWKVFEFILNGLNTVSNITLSAISCGQRSAEIKLDAAKLDAQKEYGVRVERMHEKELGYGNLTTNTGKNAERDVMPKFFR